MKFITKRIEPNSLVEHRAKEYAGYDNIPTDTKKELKEALLMEQGHVCCYCMKRIHFEDMKVEHWKPQRYVELSLLYINMLGACDGNEGNPRHLQCCDTRKGEDELTINPLDSNSEAWIKYRDDGRIFSDDETVNNDLNDVLNLNHQTIKDNRKSIIDGIVGCLNRKYPKKQWTKSNIQEEINKWIRRDSEGKYLEYYGVALFRLQKLYLKAQ
jgi:uncharacterized protein (TIGR02646 family)